MIETEFLEHLGYEKINFGVIEVDFEEYIKDNLVVKYYPHSNLFQMITYSKETGHMSRKYGEVPFRSLIENFLICEWIVFKLWKRSRTINKVLSND